MQNIRKRKSSCILCNNKFLSELEVIDSQRIVLSYKKQFNVDVQPYFERHGTITFYYCTQCGVRFYSPAVVAQGSFYEDLQKYDWYYQTSKSEYAYCSRFTANKSILEIGCGGGFFPDYAKPRLYKGLEFNQQAIDLCHQKGLEVEKKSISDFRKSHQNEYDIVCSFQVLEHVNDPYEFIKNAISCLKPEGLLLLSVPSEDSFVGLASNNVLNMPPHHLSRWQDSTFNYIGENFDIQLRAIHHEALDPIHFKWYLATIGQQIVKRWCLQPVGKTLDETIGDKITSKLGSLFGRALGKMLLRNKIPPNGHSVTVVFEKS